MYKKLFLIFEELDRISRPFFPAFSLHQTCWLEAVPLTLISFTYTLQAPDLHIFFFHLNSLLTSRWKNSIYFLYYPLVYTVLSLTAGIWHVPFSYSFCYSEWNIICLCLWYLPFSLLGFLVRIVCPILPYSVSPEEFKKSRNLNMTKIWFDIHFTRENTWLLFRKFYQKLHLKKYSEY